MNRSHLTMPEGLVETAKAAHKIIVDFMSRNDLTGTQMKMFYSPKEWQERGERYGADAVLVVVHEGADAQRCLSMDACLGGSFAKYDALQNELYAIGVFSEGCTSWYTAIYLTA